MACQYATGPAVKVILRLPDGFEVGFDLCPICQHIGVHCVKPFA